MVQRVEPDGFSVVWSVSAGRRSTIELRDERGDLVDVSPVWLEDGLQRTVRFEGLSSGAAYWYRVFVDDRAVGFHRVVTASRGPSAFRVLAFGDSGTGGLRQFGLAAVMPSYRPDMVLHVGDLVHPRGASRHYVGKFFRPYAALLPEVPFYPCAGNHDFATDEAGPMFAHFDLPSNGPAGASPGRHYWFDRGDVRFVAIDTNQTVAVLSEQVAPWLDQVLADTGTRFKIVFLHHPIFADGRYGPSYGLWTSLVPTLEGRGVHLVLNGHEHSYQRSHPVRDQKVVGPGEGGVYVTTAAGGAPLYGRGVRGIKQVAIDYRKKHGFTLIDVGADALTLQQVCIDREVVDRYTIPR